MYLRMCVHACVLCTYVLGHAWLAEEKGGAMRTIGSSRFVMYEVGGGPLALLTCRCRLRVARRNADLWLLEACDV